MKRTNLVKPLVCRCLVPVLLCGVTSAHALDQDRIRPYVGATYSYLSNVYYLDKNAPSGTYPFLKDNKFSDQLLVGRIGLNADIPWSRQNFSLRSEINSQRYSTYDTLNYTGYRFRGEWDWVVGSHWDGDLGFAYTEVGSNFIDFVNVRNVRNIAKIQEFFGSAMYRVLPDLKLRVGARQATIKNKSDGDLFIAGNLNTTSWEAGTRYFSKGGDNYVGLNFRATNGEFPNRQVVATSIVDNSYRQYEFEGVVDWQTTGLSKLRGTLGWTNRQHEQVSQRNFNGITGRFDYTYLYSGATTFTASVFRELNAFEVLTSNYIVTTGFTLGPRFMVSEKLSWRVSYDYRQRKFEGDPQFVFVPNFVVRKDTNQTYTVGADWTPSRNTLVSTDLSYQKRDSNQENFDFRAVVFSVSGQVTF